jgi:hypothetical protein
MDIFCPPVTSNQKDTAWERIVNGKPMGTSISQGKVVAGVALPEAPAVKIKSSAVT